MQHVATFFSLLFVFNGARLVERTTNALVTKDDGALEEVKKALIQVGPLNSSAAAVAEGNLLPRCTNSSTKSTRSQKPNRLA